VMLMMHLFFFLSRHHVWWQGGSVSPQSLGGPAASSGGGAPTGATSSAGRGAAPPRQQRVRARRGQATDPHSIAERVCHIATSSQPPTYIPSDFFFQKSAYYLFIDVRKGCKPSTSPFICGDSILFEFVNLLWKQLRHELTCNPPMSINHQRSICFKPKRIMANLNCMFHDPAHLH
jgi:hypothetical protein